MPFDVNGNILNNLHAKLYNSTSIIRNGLICYLDAANAESYGGSGSTWVDLSGNGNNGTINGSVTFSTVNGGVFTLPGSVGSTIDVSLNMSSTNYTVIGASRYITAVANTHTNAQGGRIISAKNNNWLMGQWYGYTENFYSEGWVSAVSAGATDTYWRVYTSTGDIGADVYSMYVNGNLTYQNGSGSQGPNGFTIGAYGPGGTEYANGQLGFLMVYNRVLSATEVRQMYQVFRPRYERYFDCGYGCQLYNYDPGCTAC